MGKNSSHSSKGVPTSAGSRKGKFGAFFSHSTEKKIRNIIKNAGKDAAEKWANERNERLAFLKVIRG